MNPRFSRSGFRFEMDSILSECAEEVAAATADYRHEVETLLAQLDEMMRPPPTVLH